MKKLIAGAAAILIGLGVGLVSTVVAPELAAGQSAEDCQQLREFEAQAEEMDPSGTFPTLFDAAADSCENQDLTAVCTILREIESQDDSGEFSALSEPILQTFEDNDGCTPESSSTSSSSTSSSSSSTSSSSTTTTSPGQTTTTEAEVAGQQTSASGALPRTGGGLLVGAGAGFGVLGLSALARRFFGIG